VIADNYSDKMRRNILTGSNGAILFITRQGKVFENMKEQNPKQQPGHAATHSGIGRLL